MDSHEEILNQIDKVIEQIRKLVAIPATERNIEQKNKLCQLRKDLKEMSDTEYEMLCEETD